MGDSGAGGGGTPGTGGGVDATLQLQPLPGEAGSVGRVRLFGWKIMTACVAFNISAISCPVRMFWRPRLRLSASSTSPARRRRCLPWSSPCWCAGWSSTSSWPCSGGPERETTWRPKGLTGRWPDPRRSRLISFKMEPWWQVEYSQEKNGIWLKTFLFIKEKLIQGFFLFKVIVYVKLFIFRIFMFDGKNNAMILFSILNSIHFFSRIHRTSTSTWTSRRSSLPSTSPALWSGSRRTWCTATGTAERTRTPPTRTPRSSRPLRYVPVLSGRSTPSPSRLPEPSSTPAT